MGKIKEYDVKNQYGTVICQTYAINPKEAQENANRMDKNLTVSKRGRKI